MAATSLPSRAASRTSATMGVAPHHVGRVAAGHDHRVELGRRRLLRLQVDADGISVLRRVALGAARADDLHLRALLAQAIVGHPQLHLLVHVLGEDRDPLARELHLSPPSGCSYVFYPRVIS